jgi:Predicted membrane protein/domain
MSQQDPASAILACSQCGRPFAHSDVVQIAGNWVCGDCKPAFLSRVMASGAAAASPLGWRYGGFWIRFAARLIDGLVLGVPLLILAAVLIPNLLRTQGDASNSAFPAFAAFGLTFFLIYFVVVICYEVVLLRYRGATLGKMACGLKVVRSDGSSLGWGVSIGRFVMWNVVTSGIPYLNFIFMLISGIMAGTDGQKRALHDRVCDTRVVIEQSIA